MTNSPAVSPETAILAAIWVILVGAGMMPTLVVIAQYVFRFAVNQAVSTACSELIKWAAITAFALALSLMATPAPKSRAEKPVAVGGADNVALTRRGTRCSDHSDVCACRHRKLGHCTNRQ